MSLLSVCTMWQFFLPLLYVCVWPLLHVCVYVNCGFFVFYACINECAHCMCECA